jgi:protein-disulfide isomerase
MGRRLEGIATTVLVACALFVTGLVARRELSAAPDPRAPVAPTHVKDWQRYVSGDERIGAAGARVTIVEFSDFQCPFCRQFTRVLDSVRARYPADVAIVFRNFPLAQLHPYARAAAIAAECAAAQGRFEQYHDFLFRHQDSLGTLSWPKSAKAAGLPDIQRFSTCLADPGPVRALAFDSAAANAIHLVGTPTVLINDLLFAGAPTLAQVIETIEADLKAIHPNSTP